MLAQMQPTFILPAWPVVGHEWAVALLARSAATEQVRHAYLFTGPAQVGKTTLARAFAQTLNCQASSEKRPCGLCDSCQRMARDAHPDARLIEPQGKSGRELLIDQVRGIIHEAALSPLLGRRKVFIVREVDRGNAPAMNALLKTLEEPPPSVVLLLTSSYPERLLPTIVSRCQVLSLRPVAVHQIEEMLRAHGAAEERAQLLARLANGRPGWALTALTDESVWQSRQEWLDNLNHLLGQGRNERLAYAERMAARAQEAPEMLALWASWWRDLLLWQQGCPEVVTHIDRRETLASQASRLSPDQVRRFLMALGSASRYLEQNVNPRLVCESLLLHLPRWEAQPA
ncbi:MAG: DNA polymerase III subunit delta' [Anaerolineae bacterium]|nr:DNA polymerase III subunit delta' [Anaerolineae bacterium]